MRFALLGNHPDGLQMARAMVAAGRHQLVAYTGPAAGAVALRQHGIEAKPVGDLEDVLADPNVEAVIVAGPESARPVQLRRSLQSERHVACVHPADLSPDTAYEAAMIQADTHMALMPLLPHALHPAVARLAELSHAQGPPGPARLIVVDWHSSQEALIGGTGARRNPAVPGWEVLYSLAGAIAEISAYAAAEEVSGDEPLLLAGQFENGVVLQAAYLPKLNENCRFTVIGSQGQSDLLFPAGWTGPAKLTWHTNALPAQELCWDAWDPWPSVVAKFEALVQTRRGSATPLEAVSSWQQETRCLELDDAVRRSVQRRRASTLEYPEATEEASFKGTMTLVGCAMLWGVLALLILSRWRPLLGWAILPLLVVFLALQFLRWVLPKAKKDG
jgi:predicted dehydrogenase